MEITKQLKNLGTVTVRQIEKQQAKEMIIKNHYSHKVNTNHGLYNFGIFRDGKLLGVTMYGYMMNPKAKIYKSSVENGMMIELNRMWIDDELGKNAESFLISTSIKLLKKINPKIVAVQSFADGRLGCGTIYKASNFKYYGYHYSLFYEVIESSEVLHKVTIENQYNSTYIKYNEMLLNGELKSFRVKTYRYIYPLDKSFEFLKGKEQPYPPYQKGLEYFDKKINKELIMRNIQTVKERFKHLLNNK